MLILMTLVMALAGLIFVREKALYLLVFLSFFFLFFVSAIVESEYSNPGLVVSEGMGEVLRIATHMSFFLLAVIMAMHRRWHITSMSACILQGLFVFFCVLSVVCRSDSIVSQLARLALYIVFVVNVLILSPNALSGKKPETFFRYALYLSLCILVLCVASFVLYGSSAYWTLRLGRPLNPRVLSEVLFVGMASGLALYHYTRKRRYVYYNLLLMPFQIWTGSRLQIFMGTLILLYMLYKNRNYLLLCILTLLPPVLLFMKVLLSNPESSGKVFARTSATSGRVDGWVNALTETSIDWLGYGGRFVLELANGDSIRLHNGFLETMMSYGVLPAIIAVFFYLLLIWRGIINFFVFQRTFLLFIALGLMLEGMFGTSFLMNLGDGYIFFLLVVIFSIGFYRPTPPPSIAYSHQVTPTKEVAS
ncbi:hypothetical protein E3226_006130 [Legionella geestiana]|uniref:O-antigen ligase family protein n=1 Tax=Legionella geestiana TaxID=45065 RepID=UPI001092AB84|nr:hypothetical protein [Legionella geestiana]QDQ40004.1 hypothetical protein E3226_006130 [Legionella geestiana]